MEIAKTGQTGSAAGALPVRQQAAPAVQSPQEKAREDRLTLSKKAVALLEEQSRKQAALKAERQRLEQMKEAGKQEAEALAKSLKVRLQCWKIAARIMDGDKVPYEDEQFLLNNDPDGYQMAMSLRRIKEDPEEWDSVLEDEEEDSDGGSAGVEGVSSASSGEAAPVEGGGEAAAVE